MPGIFTIETKDLMLNAFQPDLVKLHNGDPGDGTQNVLEDAELACSYAAASNAERGLDDDYLVPVKSGMAPTHFSTYEGETLRTKGTLDTATETFANDGHVRLPAGSCKMVLPDPE